MNTDLKMKVILGIKSVNGKCINAYRITDGHQLRDISIDQIKDALINGYKIEGLSITEGRLVETEHIPSISELNKNSISLEDWCLQNPAEGKRILQEFNSANNFPITAKDISSKSNIKMKFKCQKCGKTSEQRVAHKTDSSNCKCKYCAGLSMEQNLYDFCIQNNRQDLIYEWSPKNEDMRNYFPGSIKKVYWQDNLCEWPAIIKNRTKHNCGNPYENKTSTSYSEQLIFLWLKSQDIQCYNQYTIKAQDNIQKNFDIYIPALKLVIEHQSNLHRTLEAQMFDNISELTAQMAGLRLLEICQVSSQYERTPSNSCITYKVNHEPEMIQQLSLWFKQNYNINLNYNITRELEDQAIIKSYKVKEKDSLAVKNPVIACEWNQLKNGKITPKMVALNSPRKYYFNCKYCNSEYFQSPNVINTVIKRQGYACTNCHHPI